MTSLREILALARSGSPDRAWAAFLAGGWDRHSHDPDALTLKGRLLKDKAGRAVEGERAPLYRLAANAYAAAAALAPATYPLINAATLALLGGEPGAAEGLAARVLDLIDRGVHQPETPYWLEATRAEALLLLDRPDAARATLAAAIRREPGAWEDHAATIGQFARILAAQGADTAWLDRYRPPASLYFHGIMGLAPDDADAAARIDAIVAAERPGFAFGALAAGADILIAEAALRQSATLHIVLPCPVAAFRAASVVAVDDRWGPRFDALIAAADRVEAASAPPLPHTGAITLGNRMARGLAMRNARLLQSKALALAVTDGSEDGRPDTAWQNAGGSTATITLDRSATTPPPIGDDAAHPIAIVAVPDTGPAGQIDGRRTEKAGDLRLIIVDTPAQALAAAQAIARDAILPTALALDYGLGTAGKLDPALIARATTLGHAAREGQWLASRPMALALELATPRPIIEIGGEVRGPSGTHPVFDIAPSLTPSDPQAVVARRSGSDRSIGE